MRAATAGLILALLLAWAVLPVGQEPAYAQGKGGGGKGGGGKVSCTIDSVTSVAFGNYDTESGIPLTSSGQLLFSCTPPRTVTIKVTIGPSAVSGSIADRAMRQLDGRDQLHYNLFQDARGSVIWGDGMNGGSAAFITGSKTFRAEIYGIVRERQEVSEGVYADTLRITLAP